MWDTVGLVGKTGVDISGEEAGLYCDPDAGCDWAPVDLANRAFGQGVSATLLQLANGVSTLVNGGFRVQPHVVAEGELAQVPKRRVLRPKIAQQAQEILEHVTGAVSWYAEGALIPGYMIGGKTGTAQIWDNQRNRWKPDIFNRNFVGYVGGNKPEVVIAVRIEEPKLAIQGQGRIETKIESYELFRNIAEGAIKHLGIRKSKDRNAGLPIIGTQAARVLTPERDRAGRAQRRQTDGGSDSTVEQRKKGSKSKPSDPANAGSDPDGVEGQSDGSEP
jgi:cell division protein FtsI (penicillin-binding protein 3)